MAVFYGIYFTLNGVVVRMPINPEELKIENPGESEEYNVLGIGPVIQQRSPGLRKCTLESYWPGERTAPGVLTGSDWHDPAFYIKYFREAMQEKYWILFTPVRYDEQGRQYGPSDPGFYVIVDGFEYEERGGETKDFYYSLKLVEYKDFSAKQVKVNDTLYGYTPIPTRQKAPDKIVVGTKCRALGEVMPAPNEARRYGSRTLHNAEVTVVYIADLSKNAYPYRVSNIYGEEEGWMARESLTVLS